MTSHPENLNKKFVRLRDPNHSNISAIVLLRFPHSISGESGDDGNGNVSEHRLFAERNRIRLKFSLYSFAIAVFALEGHTEI